MFIGACLPARRSRRGRPRKGPTRAGPPAGPDMWQKGPSLPLRYDFDHIIDRRNTNCEKWDQNTAHFGSEDVLPMWVADMDFPCPQPVLDALRRRLDHPIFGYGFPPESLYQAVIDRLERRFGWKVAKEWITFVPGVVTAVYSAIQALASPGDDVLLQLPVYFPFFRAVTDSGCQIVANPLRVEGRYVMDFDGLARCFGGKNAYGRVARPKTLVFCSPHNPVGRVWEPAELTHLVQVCLENDCPIISDEIHCDLMIGGARHTPLASLSPEIAWRTITLMAPSKTFNLAGLEASFAIIPDPELKRRFERARRGQSGVNVLGMVAMEAALRDGDEYLDQLNAYLTGNVRYFAEAVAGIPGLRLVPSGGPEGTYLAWVDARGLGLGEEQLEDFILRKARVAPNFGRVFGPGGEGFLRVNLGCPRSIIGEAVARLRAAVGELRG